MDAETDFGLFEILLILAMLGVGGYLIWKNFFSQTPDPLAQKAADQKSAQIVSCAIGQCVTPKQVQCARGQIAAQTGSNTGNGLCVGGIGTCANPLGLNTCNRSWWEKLFGIQDYYKASCIAPACGIPASATGKTGGCAIAAAKAADPYLCCCFINGT